MKPRRTAPVADRRPPTVTLRRLMWIWLLPLLLAMGQYGHFRHELDHYTPATASTPSPSPSPEKQRPADADRCALCMSYGHLSAAIGSDSAAPHLRSELLHRLVAQRSCPSADADLPAVRNRGPPAA